MINHSLSTSQPIVECVLNVSIGRNEAFKQYVKNAFTKPGKLYLLHYDMGHDTNRSVLTIFGNVEILLDQLSELVAFCQDTFNIEEHQGIHPRIGILDVIPFIAISNISEDELKVRIVQWCNLINEKFQLPFFFYGNMAVAKNRRSLHYFRFKGINYLNERLDKGLTFDVGIKTHSILGVSCVTVRDFMGAFNINLNTQDLFVARKLAARLRRLRDNGEILKLKDVKFLAWYISEYGCCQISTNIYDLKSITLFELYKIVSEHAKHYSLVLSGSELIGMIPSRGICPLEVDLDQALSLLKLNDVRPFSKESQIIENRLSSIQWDD